jgi:hypothetical protein
VTIDDVNEAPVSVGAAVGVNAQDDHITVVAG